ncbi:unnamed protein product [Closterium sp. NIES-54]
MGSTPQDVLQLQQLLQELQRQQGNQQNQNQQNLNQQNQNQQRRQPEQQLPQQQRQSPQQQQQHQPQQQQRSSPQDQQIQSVLHELTSLLGGAGASNAAIGGVTSPHSPISSMNLQVHLRAADASARTPTSPMSPFSMGGNASPASPPRSAGLAGGGAEAEGLAERAG